MCSSDLGLRMIDRADKWDPEKDAEKAFAAVNPNDPTYQSHIKGLGDELARGEDADKKKVAEMLMALPYNERAQFIRDYNEARKLAPQGVDMGDTKRQKYLPPDLSKLLADDKEALAAYNQASKLASAQTPQKDAQRAQRVQESITIGRKAAQALGVDPRTAFAMVDGLAKDSGLSPANALRFLKGEELKDESDKRSPFVKKMCEDVKSRAMAGKPLRAFMEMQPADPKDKLDGNTLSKPKVDKLQTFLTSADKKSDAAVVAMIQGCNPRELAEVDKQLRARTPPTSIAELTKGVDGADRKELAPLLRGMEDFQTLESHYRLMRTVKEQDPRKDASAATPEGFAERLAWARDLPPEQRLAELNRLRKEAGGAQPFGAKEVMAAWLNGPQGKGSGTEPTMLSSAMQAQLDAIDRLPSKAARDQALENLAKLTGRWNEKGTDATAKDFQRARAHTAEGMQVGKKMQEIAEMPEADREAAILELSRSSKLSIDRLHELHDESLKAGLVTAGPKEVTPDVARRIADIRALPEKDQAAAIHKLESETGLSPQDINAHLQSDLEAAKKKIDERNRAQQGADSLKDKIVAGDTAGVQKQLEECTDPAELKRILDAYGPALDHDLKVLFGDRRVAQASPLAYLIAGDDLGTHVAQHDINYRLVMDMVQGGRDFSPAPELPPGVSPLVSEEVRRIKNQHLPPEQEQAELESLRARKGLVEEEFAVVLEHAKVTQEQFEKTVERKMKLLEAEKRTGFFDYVSDSNVDRVTKGMSPEVLAEINRRNPALVANIQKIGRAHV